MDVGGRVCRPKACAPSLSSGMLSAAGGIEFADRELSRVSDGISGAELAERARQQASKFGIEFLMMREGIKAEFHNNRIHVDLADGSHLVARANICATGIEWRRLGLTNEDQFLGVGVYYGGGASEAPFCVDLHVVVWSGAATPLARRS